MKFQLAVLAALSALLVAAVRVLLLLLTGLLSALLRIALLLLARLAVRIILMLRILVRIGHDCSLHCGAAHQANAPAAITFLRFSGSIAAEQFTGTQGRNARNAVALSAQMTEQRHGSA
jgi:hypothetical protein